MRLAEKCLKTGSFQAKGAKWLDSDPPALTQAFFMGLGEGKGGLGVSRETLKPPWGA